MSAGGPPVRVHIEVLSLPEGTRARGAAIGEAVRSELMRLLATTSLQQQLRERAAVAPQVPALDGGRIPLPAGERPRKVGQRIAAQVARGLSAAPDRRRP